MASDGSISGKEIFLDDSIERIKLVLSLFDELILKFDAVEKKAKSANNSISFAEAEKENAEAVKKSRNALSEYEKTQRRLEQQEEKRAVAQTRLARRLAEQRVETQRINRETKRNTTILNENERAYTRLSRLYARQKDDLKDLAIQYGANSDIVQRFARRVEETRGKIKAADDIAKEYGRNVGNYPKQFGPAITTVKQLIGAFGAVEAIRFGIRLIRDLSETAREAKGVQFAFERLGDSAEDSFDRIKKSTRGLFSDLDIKRAIVEFDNFRLSAEQLDTIFEFIAVRATQTGQSFEYLKNSAIEAITKESVLRADNLGLSQKALNEEIEKGADFLTAFGNIAQREVSRAGNILDEAADSGQQFNATLENIKLELSDLIKNFGILKFASDSLNAINNSIKASAISGSELNIEIQEIRDGILENESAVSRLGAVLLGSLSPAGRRVNNLVLEEIERRRDLIKEIEAQTKAYERLYGIGSGPLTEEQSRARQEDGFNIFDVPQEKQIRTLELINEEIEKQRDLLDNTGTSDKKRLITIANKIKALEAEKEAVLDLLDTEKKGTKARQEFIDTFELDSENTLNATITFLQNMQKEVAIGSSEWFALDKQIKDVQKTLQDLLDNANFDVGSINFIDEDTAQDALDVENFLNTEGIELQAKLLAESLKQTQEELLAEYDSLYERDYMNFVKWAKKKVEAEIEANNRREEVLSNIINVGQDFAQAFYEIQANRIDDEIEKQNEAFDNIVNSKESSEETIAIAEKKRAENEKRLRKERERAERRAFLIQQAMEVARVILADATARANATATSFLLPPVAAQAYLAGAQAQITTNTAIALAAILAQSIPAFFKGKNALDSYEGPATWGEKRKEVRITEDGGVEISPNRTTPLWVNRNDIITPSVPEFERQMKDPGSEIFRRVVGNKYRTDTRSRMQVVYVKSENDRDMSSKLDQTNRLLRKIERKETRFDPKLSIELPTKYFSA